PAAITRSLTIRGQSSGSLSTSSWRLIPGRPRRSSWTWTRPTSRCTGTRRAVSSTAITTATAIYRSTSTVAATCWLPCSGDPTRTRRRVRSRKFARIVGQIRGRWPRTRILLRGDSGFAREGLMAWCETNRVDFPFGRARNARLARQISREIEWAEEAARRRGRPARRYKDFLWSTLESWSRRRRVVAKAEWLGDKANPRFVVTSLK